MEYLQDMNVSNYKYSSLDKSPLSKYVLNPYYWTPLAEYLPVYLHANMVTLLGLMGIIVILIITYIVDGLDGRYTWLSWACAIGIWFYSTMDNLDGKQARRTMTSSPLGELVDHGCDAVQCCFGGIVQATGMGLGYSYYTLWVVGIASVPFYFSSWEEYYTKTLYLGYVNGPTEGLLIGSICGIIGAVYGNQIYFLPYSDFEGNLFGSLLYPFKLCVAFFFNMLDMDKEIIALDILVFIMLCAVFIVHVPACIYNVYMTPKRKEPMLLALFKTYPIALFILSGFLLAQVDLIWIPNIFWMTMLACTLSFGVYTTQVILAYIVEKQYPSPSALWSLFSLSLFLKYSDASIQTKTFALYLFTSFFVVYYCYFIESVFLAFCNHLKISWYKVPLENQKQLLNQLQKKNK